MADWKINASNWLMPEILRLWDGWVTHAISGGTVAVTSSLVELQSESGSTDTLDTLTGGVEGQMILVRAEAGDTITLTYGTSAGEFLMQSGTDEDITINDVLLFIHNGTAWKEVGVTASGAGATGYTTIEGDGTAATQRTVANFVSGEGIGVTVADDAGNSETDVTHDLDINGLTADASPDGAADYVATWDASASAHKKVLLDDLPGGGGGGSTGCKVYLTSDQTMNALADDVEWDAEYFDDDTMWSSGSASRLTIQTAGRYHINMQLWVNLGSADSSAGRLTVYDSSDTFLFDIVTERKYAADLSGSTVQHLLSFHHEFDADDYIIVSVDPRASGKSVTLVADTGSGGSKFTWLEAISH